MKTLKSALVSFLRNEDGPTAVEYAVMLALIIVVCITAITALGSNANNTFSYVATQAAPKPYLACGRSSGVHHVDNRPPRVGRSNNIRNRHAPSIVRQARRCSGRRRPLPGSSSPARSQASIHLYASR
jgi:pilus assembly protein Flp/PilA